MSVVTDKQQSKPWPRPESIRCACGQTAHQFGGPQSISYACLHCNTTTVHYTGFDDPAWS